MKIKMLRCGICGEFHHFPGHCQNCGAYRVVVNGKARYYNAKGREIVRGFPMPVDKVIERVVCRAQDGEARLVKGQDNV